MAVHRFTLMGLALIFTAVSLALFVYKRFENQDGLRWGAVGITVILWLASVYVAVCPVNMSSFTHLATVGQQYQFQPTKKAKLADREVLKVKDITGKQIILPHIDEYTIAQQKDGLATNRIVVRRRVINKNATKLQREYFEKVAPRSFNNDPNASRGQLTISLANK